MSTSNVETPQHSTAEPLSREEVMRIAHEDAKKVYRDLRGYDVAAALEEDGWHVDYRLKDPSAVGGGPHYIIDAVTGKILSKKYQQ